MCLIFKTKISFQQILDLYDALILASYEKNLGQELLGSEICAYGYWNLLEDKGLGYMKINDFVNFLKVKSKLATRLIKFYKGF